MQKQVDKYEFFKTHLATGGNICEIILQVIAESHVFSDGIHTFTGSKDFATRIRYVFRKQDGSETYTSTTELEPWTILNISSSVWEGYYITDLLAAQADKEKFIENGQEKLKSKKESET